MTKVLGLDPGKTTGYAQIGVSDRTFQLLSFGNTEDMTLVNIKHLIEDSDVVVYEGWRTFRKHAMAGRLNYQTVPAEQVIGSLKTLLRLQTRQPVVKENLSSILPVGYGWAGMHYHSGMKKIHWKDALAHAVHYSVSTLGVHPVVMKS